MNRINIRVDGDTARITLGEDHEAFVFDTQAQLWNRLMLTILFMVTSPHAPAEIAGLHQRTSNSMRDGVRERMTLMDNLASTHLQGERLQKYYAMRERLLL